MAVAELRYKKRMGDKQKSYKELCKISDSIQKEEKKTTPSPVLSSIYALPGPIRGKAFSHKS